MGMTETASRIIARFGQAGAFERTSEQLNPWDPPGTTTTHPATVAVVTYDQDHRDGTLIRADDLRVLVSVAGLDIEPAVSDKLIVGGETYNIVHVAPLGPDGVPRFHDLQVRK